MLLLRSACRMAASQIAPSEVLPVVASVAVVATLAAIRSWRHLVFGVEKDAAGLLHSPLVEGKVLPVYKDAANAMMEPSAIHTAIFSSSDAVTEAGSCCRELHMAQEAVYAALDQLETMREALPKQGELVRTPPGHFVDAREIFFLARRLGEVMEQAKSPSWHIGRHVLMQQLRHEVESLSSVECRAQTFCMAAGSSSSTLESRQLSLILPEIGAEYIGPFLGLGKQDRQGVSPLISDPEATMRIKAVVEDLLDYEDGDSRTYHLHASDVGSAVGWSFSKLQRRSDPYA